MVRKYSLLSEYFLFLEPNNLETYLLIAILAVVHQAIALLVSDEAYGRLDLTNVVKLKIPYKI